MHESMIMEYEPSSEPLHISAKLLFLDGAWRREADSVLCREANGVWRRE